MAYTSIGRNGLLWPVKPGSWFALNNVTLDAANEAFFIVGRMHWSDSGSHTVDTTGSSKIYLHTGGTAVFDDATAVMHIGIQDVDTTTGVPTRPDGTYDVHAVVTTAADTTPALTTTNSFVAATPTAGTKTIAHGGLIAVGATLITVGSSPASNMIFTRGGPGDFNGAGVGFPANPAFTGGSWSNGNNCSSLLVVASDGTYGTIDGVGQIGQLTTTVFTDSSNPDEYGNIFQVPFNCKAGGFTFIGGLTGATSDIQYDLTSTPTGTPSSLISGPISVVAESTGVGTSDAGFTFQFATPVALSANTDYCISIKATGAGNVTIYGMTLPAAGARVLLPGGTNTQGATRNGGSGAFTGSTTIIRSIGVRITEIDFPAGGGGTYFSVGG